MNGLVAFDRTEVDPTARDGGYTELLFSQRCGMNALETGMRVLTGRRLHARALFNNRTARLIWVSQETCREVPAP